MIKLSDYVCKFIEQLGVKHVFMLPGGGCIHLVDSVGKNKSLEYVCVMHEQAAAVAAESYSQYTNNIGVCIVTSGPGATNAITGVSAAWIDSTPVLFISGQAKRSDLMGGSGVRQMGSQEVGIVSIVESITKYAVQILEPNDIKYHLEKAYHEAVNGRKGPVWLDIPLDVQAAEIDERALKGYTPEKSMFNDFENNINSILDLIDNSERPLILAGNGIKLSGQSELFLEIIEKMGIPTLATWKIIDMFDYDNPMFFGLPGTLGQRFANFILQNCDLLIVLGSRLDSSLTAFNHANFAKGAKKVMVDIDQCEIKKMQMDIDISVVTDLKEFLPVFNKKAKPVKHIKPWLDYCIEMKEKYPVVLKEYFDEKQYVNTYCFISVLCNNLKNDDIIVPESSGSAGEVTYQAFKIKMGQKMRNAAGLGSMGFGLPYAIGACLSQNKKRTVLINGDGAFQLNIQELQTVVRLNLPIKIFIWNNGGYASIMATQRNMFDGHYVASEEKSGLSLPDISKVAATYGLKTFSIKHNSELQDGIKQVLEHEGPVLCEIMVSPFQTTAPKVQSMKTPNGSMISKPLEDMWPFLEEAEIKANMRF